MGMGGIENQEKDRVTVGKKGRPALGGGGGNKRKGKIKSKVG